MTTQSPHLGRERGHRAPGATMTMPPDAPAGVPDADAVMARATGENFTVASRLLPAASRGHLLAVYGFARLVDDIGDEGELDRTGALDWLDGELALAAEGRAHHPVLVRLTPTLRELG